MTKEEIVKAITDIDEQMEELKKVYEPYVGMRLEDLSNEDQERIRKFWILILQLTNAKADLRAKALYEHHIFVM